MPKRHECRIALSSAARDRIAKDLRRQATVRHYSARTMHLRQAAIRAFIDPRSQPAVIAAIREIYGTAIHRRSATRVWALKHLKNALAALRAFPAPHLP